MGLHNKGGREGIKVGKREGEKEGRKREGKKEEKKAYFYQAPNISRICFS